MKRPFYCGSQFGDWKARNCDRCVKGYDINWHCELEQALDDAYMDVGQVNEGVYHRIGADENKLANTWDCPERELKEQP